MNTSGNPSGRGGGLGAECAFLPTLFPHSPHARIDCGVGQRLYCSLRSRRKERFWRSTRGGGLRQAGRSAFGARLAQALLPPHVSLRVLCEEPFPSSPAQRAVKRMFGRDALCRVRSGPDEAGPSLAPSPYWSLAVGIGCFHIFTFSHSPFPVPRSPFPVPRSPFSPRENRLWRRAWPVVATSMRA